MKLSISKLCEGYSKEFIAQKYSKNFLKNSLNK